MPRPALVVHLPQPCQQSWEAMTPTAAGRHCAACQHEVVDFSAYTDGELAAYLARPGRVPCGRFRASQLNRVLRPTPQPVAGWRRWWGTVAAVLGLGALATPARAQTRPGHVATPQPQRPRQPKKPVRPTHRAGYPQPPSVPVEPEILGGAPLIEFYPDSLMKPRK